MSKISELSDGGSLQSTDYLIAVRSGGNVKVQADGNLSLGALTLTGLTVDTNTLHVDATNNRVGVGTASPGANLEISSATAAILRLTDSADSAYSQIRADAGTLQLDANAGNAAVTEYISMRIAGDEAARLDASGNVLVGQSSTATPGTGNTTTGISLRGSDGVLHTSRNGNRSLYANRSGTDGPVISVLKDGTEVGSIGSDAGVTIYMDGGGARAGIYMSSSGILPRYNGALADNATDLGASNRRFKDLYLSSGVVVDDGAGRLTLAANTGVNNLFSTTTGFGAYEDLAIIGDNLIFKNGTTEAARITSAGNVLVGATTATISNEMVYMLSDGRTGISAAGDIPLIVNRKTDAGGIVEVRKDQAVIGNIGVDSGGVLQVVSDSTSLHLRPNNGTNSTSNYIYTQGGPTPWSDNYYDLGLPSYRYKSLYLSGGVYLGGTTSANYLDDYEEGTWTPTITGSTTAGSYGSLSTQAYYTKIGRAVHVTMVFFGASGTGAGDMLIGGLPFTSHPTSNSVCVLQYNSGLDLPTGTHTPVAFLPASTTTMEVRCSSDGTGNYTPMPYPTAPTYVRLTMTYFTP